MLCYFLFFSLVTCIKNAGPATWIWPQTKEGRDGGGKAITGLLFVFV